LIRVKRGATESYTEINEQTVGKFLRRETAIARRVGDCGK